MTRLLVLSGGGAKGSYEAGAVQALTHLKNRTYDGFYGVSAGALNASVLACYGNDKEGASALFQTWSSLKQSDIYRFWKCWYFSLFWKNSLYDTAPLKQLIAKSISRDKLLSSGKMLAVQTVGLRSGNAKTFYHNDTDILDAVLASGSMPIYFPPVSMGTDLYVDGGVRNMVNLETALGTLPDEIDVVLTYPKHQKPYTCASFSIIDIISRFIAISLMEIGKDDILIPELESKIQDKTKIRIVRPSIDLDCDSLKFDHDQMMRAMDLGFMDANKMEF